MSAAMRQPATVVAATGAARIAARFAALRAEGRGGLVTFITAGDPDPATAEGILTGLPAAGADIVELGMPFSDPMADGVAIQRASGRALRAGQTMAGTLALVRRFRLVDTDTPLVLMGYFNPILSYGPAAFARDAAAAGADGCIVVDLPPEEAGELAPHLAAEGLALIRLATPTSDANRLPRILDGASGFVYYVSVLGVTGTRSASEGQIEAAMAQLRRFTNLPIAVGFGIKTKEQVAAAARLGDAAVVGSALVQTIESHLDGEGRAKPGLVGAVLSLVQTLAAAVRHQGR